MDGIIVIYKEKGFTSFDVVAKLRGILGIRKIGHTGTLDPDAEGVLPVCVGKATKLCGMFTEKDKIYDTVLRLGITTDTQDMSGEILSQRTPDITSEQLKKLIMDFIGKQNQIPPMYSALKVNGQKLCDLARKGIEVERNPREIEIFSIENIQIEMPNVSMRVHCSKGTYIRTLCHDIGTAAGCGGCMERLLRVETAGFSLKEAHRLSEVEDIKNGLQKDVGIEDILLSIDGVLKFYPAAFADSKADKLLSNGNRLPAEFIRNTEGMIADKCRMYDSAYRFIGIYEYLRTTEEFKPVKMFI